MEPDIESLVDWDRIFRPGVEFRAYPVSKWEHARLLSMQLRAEFNAYREALGVETNVDFSDDRRLAEFRARLTHEPPVEHWSLLLGDSLHNYRSALDGLAWELANLDGRKVAPEHERQLYFPLADTEPKWHKLQRTTLSSMPPVILNRLERVQPYRFEPVELGIGILLHEMNKLDKHRAELQVEMRVVDKTTFSIEARYESGDGPANFDYEFLASEAPVSDGDLLFRFKEREPLQWARVEKLPMPLCVVIHDDLHNVFELLELIERQVAGTFINACVGLHSPEWFDYVSGRGPRPEAPWYPNLARYSDEMRAGIGSRLDVGGA